MNVLLFTLGFSILGYLSGSLPFSIWITRLFKGVDVRGAGSGHATTTNTIRQAGFASADQVRVVSPYDAIAAGATHLVVGRPILDAPRPAQAAEAIVRQIEEAQSVACR